MNTMTKTNSLLSTHLGTIVHHKLLIAACVHEAYTLSRVLRCLFLDPGTGPHSPMSTNVVVVVVVVVGVFVIRFSKY